MMDEAIMTSVLIITTNLHLVEIMVEMLSCTCIFVFSRIDKDISIVE